MVAWGWQRVPEGQEQRNTRKLLRGGHVHYLLTCSLVLTVSQVCALIRTYHTVHFEYVVYCMSVVP